MTRVISDTDMTLSFERSTMVTPSMQTLTWVLTPGATVSACGFSGSRRQSSESRRKQPDRRRETSCVQLSQDYLSKALHRGKRKAGGYYSRSLRRSFSTATVTQMANTDVSCPQCGFTMRPGILCPSTNCYFRTDTQKSIREHESEPCSVCQDTGIIHLIGGPVPCDVCR